MFVFMIVSVFILMCLAFINLSILYPVDFICNQYFATTTFHSSKILFNHKIGVWFRFLLVHNLY